MSSQIVILLAVREIGGKQRAFGSSQTAVMKEEFLAERARFPALHAGSGDSNPVDTSRPVGYISSDFLEASAAKELAPASNMVLPFKTIRCRAIPLFMKNGPGDSESGVFLKLLHQKF